MNRVRPVVALLLALAILDVLAASAPGAVPVHHDIDLRLWPETGRLEAVDRIELQGFPEIEVTLAPGLAVQRARLDGRSVPVRGQNGSWRIEGEAREGKVLTLEYGGRLEGADGRAAPFLESEGGFLPAGSSWLPLADEGLVTFELALEVPQPFKAVATGALVNEAADADGYRARFAQTRAGEAPSVLVGPYVITEQRAGDVRLRTYFYEDDPALARRYLSQAAAYIALYERWVGDYPFADFHIVAAPLPLGLGFPGLTYVSRRILRLPFMRTTSLAHEILHSWWGGAIEVAYEEGNWAEGLTTYMADYAIAEHDSAARAREMRLAWLRDFAALPPERDVALVDFVAKRHAAAQVIGYNKAAFIFHMLRKLAGDAVFQQALQLFWRRHRFETASWADLQGSFEAVLDQDLSWFFQQWLERPGAPRLHLEDVSAHPTMSGYELEMTLRRDPPWYRLSVPVAVETQGGIVETEVPLAGPRATARIELDARPLALTVDPDYDVFRRLAPGEAPPILRDVTLRNDVQLIVAASDDEARTLARDLTHRMMDRAPPEVERGNETAAATAPLLLIGLTDEVHELSAELELPPTPQSLAGRGSARVWVMRRAGREPLLVVEAEDAAALEALLRPLPHYGGSSFLVFDGGQAVARGVWPATHSPLTRRLE